MTSKEVTLEDFAASKPSNKLSYYDLSLLQKSNGNNIEFSIYNVISDYMADINAVTVDIVLTEEEYMKYRYKPKLLANKVYGNPELFFIILLVNGIWSVKDFNYRKIKLVKRKDLSTMLSSINSSERSFLDTYNNSQAI
jgi:hypothetical protein